MQSISAIAWFPTVALICGLVFGVLTLSCACLMIIKEQRPSGISTILAMLGAFLLIVSIWQSRSGNIRKLQAQISHLEQQNQQLRKELEETSGKQQTQSATLGDTDMKLQTSFNALQKAATQHRQQLESLSYTQTQLNQLLTEMQKKIDQQADQVQNLSAQQQEVSDSHSTKITEHTHLLDYLVAQIEQLKTDFTAMSADHSEQLENLEKQRRALVTQLDGIANQHRTDLKPLL
jgi:DNA repair exonuclease SbcCD ATPase subunit